MKGTPKMTGITLLPIPDDLPLWTRQSAENLRCRMTDPSKCYEHNGVRYWRGTDKVIPPHVYEDAFVECPAAQKAAREAELDTFFARYKARQPAEPSSEERYEALAAFGPGVEVVDAITGRTFTT